MRHLVRILLLLFVFTIPWEYSLDLGVPLGNIARIVGLIVLAVAVLAALQAGSIRRLCILHWLILAFYLWLCCSIFWTVDSATTLEKLRGYFQEMIIVWLCWEFVADLDSLRAVFCAWLGGSWVLAVLTIANFASALALARSQVRFVAVGQDPNDVARFLDLGFPISAILLQSGKNRLLRIASIGYFISGLTALLLTGSRGGLVAAVVAFGGSAVVLMCDSPRTTWRFAAALPLFASVLWFIVPPATYERLATLLGQIQGGDLNQRTSIWSIGWQAFVQAPLFGHGAGTFVLSAGLAPIDTAHNTPLSILVETGVVGLALASAVVVAAVVAASRMNGPLRIAFLTLMATWFVSSLVGTVAESRTTWLIFGVISVGARLSLERAQSTSAAERESVTEQVVLPSRALGTE